MQTDEQQRAEQENAYRRGYVHGMEEVARLAIRLMELGYTTTTIKRLLAVYDDHFIAPWRVGDLSERSSPPPFDSSACQAILEGTSGYDWIV
jgi:hypothetical protein